MKLTRRIFDRFVTVAALFGIRERSRTRMAANARGYMGQVVSMVGVGEQKAGIRGSTVVRSAMQMMVRKDDMRATFRGIIPLASNPLQSEPPIKLRGVSQPTPVVPERSVGQQQRFAS